MATARRVALISSSYAPYPGGVEEHTRNVAIELATRGHEVEVWTVDRGEHLGTRTVDGLTVHYLPTPLPSASPRGVLSFARAALPAANAWRQVLRRLRPDVLHVQCFGPNGVYAWVLGRLTGLPLVVSSHGETFADQDDVFSHSRLLAGGLRRALRDAAAVTGCSTMVLDDLTRRFGLRRPAVVIPNGVDLEEAERLGLAGITRDPEAPPSVFAVGRIVGVKGFDLLVRAFSGAALPPRSRLVIGGDGPDLAAVRSLAAELGVGDRVEFPGRLDRRQVLIGMARADVVVVPSRAEAFGIVVLEAWRSGTALVATTHGGPADLVTDDQDGLLVDPTNTEALGEALVRLLADGRLRQRLGSNGVRAVQEFTWGRTADAYEHLYATVASERRGATAAPRTARKSGLDHG